MTSITDDDSELSPVTPTTLQKYFAHSERELANQEKNGKSKHTSDSSSITYRNSPTKLHKRILWSALVPGFFALLVTLGLASTLVGWLYATKISVQRRCDPNVNNQSPMCPGNNDQVLFTTVPVNIILTVSKIVDSAQSACSGVIMLLAAFRLSQSWQMNIAASSITLPEFSELVALCTSGRLWALGNAISLLWRRRKNSKSVLLIKAIVISFFAQLLSHTISLVDIYLHEATTTSMTSAGLRQSIDASTQYGRVVNTSCSDPVVSGVRLTGPCSVGASSLGQYLRHPNEAYGVYANLSTTERVAQTYGQSVENLAITVDARLSGTENFNATTVGMSGQCRVATKACNLVSIPHGTSGYNCSSVGLNYAEMTAGYGLGATGIHNIATEVSTSPNSTNLTMGMPDDSVTQLRLLIPLQVPSVGNNSDDGFVGTGSIGQSVLTPQLILWCSLVAHSVAYEYRSGDIVVLNSSVLAKNESQVLLYPIMTAQVADTISQTNSDALSGNSTAYANAFARQLAANSLAYGSGNTLSSRPIDNEGYIMGAQLTTSVPLRALYPFIVLIYVYGLYILVLLVGAMTCSDEAVDKQRNKKFKDRIVTKDPSDGYANIVRLGQLRLTNPAFVIHQLLGASRDRSVETFDSNLWSTEEKNETVKFAREFIGEQGVRGVGLYV